MAAAADIRTEAQRVHLVQKGLTLLSIDERNTFLSVLADRLSAERELIFTANAADLKEAEQQKVASPLIKRLAFDDGKLEASCQGLRQIAALPDPIHQVILERELDEHLVLTKESCPIGVIGMIFESRPDALIQIAALCLKSGNGVLLKGGSEALRTNKVLTSIIRETSRAHLPPEIADGWILLLESRDDVTEMLTMEGIIDLIIPRGSNQFVRYIMDHTTIPVLGHADGICHLYIDEDAETGMAVDIAVDSKCQYPAACNSVETILVHREAAGRIVPPLCAALEEQGVEIRGDHGVQQLHACTPAVDEDWETEYLDLIVSIRIVSSLDEAVEHINRFGSSHTEAIVTENRQRADYFLEAVDAADVYWNCSTRFADGFRYGLGAEVGISTHKIHARGPVGLEGLLSSKWKLRGAGHLVRDYSGPQRRRFTHERETDNQ